MPTTDVPTTFTIEVERKALLAALQRVRWVVPRRSIKPVLGGVHLAASGGELRLTGTDLEASLSVTVNADGHLPPCLVDCEDLTKRVKAGKALPAGRHGEACSLRLDIEAGTLAINAGRVEHRLYTLDVKDYPPVPDGLEGTQWRVDAQEFRNGLAVAILAAATESTRYAINGVLLEVDEDAARLVATDGRRLAVVELDRQEGSFHGRTILPRRVAALAGKLIGPKGDIAIAVFVKPGGDDRPADLCVAGPDWRLFCQEIEGGFPLYRDLIPASHSKFIADRTELMEVLNQVAMSTDECANSVRFDLGAESIRLSAGLADGGESSGSVPAEFAGGGDDRIITALLPGLVLDALKSLPGERVVIDVEQNRRSTVDGRVTSRPVVIQSVDSPAVRWLIMPVSLTLPASRETLGSNFDDGENQSPLDFESSTPADASKSGRSRPARRNTEHIWPEIGTRLDGELDGQVYAALVVAAPKLKSGRALQVISGAALGQTFNSMTAAMEAATAKQRRQAGSGRKGLPKSGWDFWHPAEARRLSA